MNVDDSEVNTPSIYSNRGVEQCIPKTAIIRVFEVADGGCGGGEVCGSEDLVHGRLRVAGGTKLDCGVVSHPANVLTCAGVVLVKCGSTWWG